MLKIYFFETSQWVFFLKYGTVFWICTKLDTILPGHRRKLFKTWEVWKNVTSFDEVTKNSQKFLYSPTPRAISWAGSVGWSANLILTRLMFRCRIVLSRHVTEINSSEHAQKKNQFVEDARKERLVKVWWSRSFWIVILLALISKYWTIYLHQSVSVKLSWCKTWRLKPKTNSLYDT